MELSTSDKLTIMCEYAKIVSTEDIVNQRTYMGKIISESPFVTNNLDVMRTTHVINVFQLNPHIEVNLKKRAFKAYVRDNPELIEQVFQDIFLKLSHAPSLVNVMASELIAKSEKLQIEKNVLKEANQVNVIIKQKVKL